MLALRGLGSPIQTRVLNVYLLGSEGQPLVTWTFQNAWPVKWEVGALDASDTTSFLIETLEIAYTTVVSSPRQS
jgi:phage tail-like protein